jgi:hypothetical protein
LRLCRHRKNAHRTHTNIHASVGFEPTISVLERTKTVRALDRTNNNNNKNVISILFSMSRYFVLLYRNERPVVPCDYSYDVTAGQRGQQCPTRGANRVIVPCCFESDVSRDARGRAGLFPRVADWIPAWTCRSPTAGLTI